MSACETCWGDAYARAGMLGGSQVEHYYALLAERAPAHAKKRAAETDRDETATAETKEPR